MKIEIKRTEENLDLLKSMASRDKATSMAAQEALAAFMGPIIAQVLDQVATSQLVYKNYSYNFGESPSIPLDLFDSNTEGLIDVWSQTAPGGLATNQIHGTDDFRFTTYRLDTAISFLKRYAQESRLDVVQLAMQRMAQEVLVKQEYKAWEVVLGSVASSTIGGHSPVYASNVAGTLTIDDINTLWTKVKRFRTSWVGGTPMTTPGRGLTHLIVSPEVIGDIRSMAYNPQNKTAVPDTAESTALGLPDGVRQQIWDNVGIPTIWGLQLVELLEFGVGQVYNTLFDTYYTPVGDGASFDATTQEIVLGLDLSIDAFLRITALDGEGSNFTVESDDQFVRRQEKVGFFGMLEEGRIGLDKRCAAAIRL